MKTVPMSMNSSFYLVLAYNTCLVIIMQNLVCVIIIIALGFCRVVSTEKLSWKLVRVWIPVNIIFVGMLFTGMYRYQLLLII
jgi:GDP-mannose transporter